MPVTQQPFDNRKVAAAVFLSAAVLASLPSGLASAEPSPEIRLSKSNSVPACVTPARLMAFLKSRNPNLSSRYANLAQHYQRHGKTWRVRWDYAFFQMLHETNYLKFGGDVVPSQNNFAGLGTTGNGVRGDRFPNISTGVLGQIHHLVAYSGERVKKPAARRTRRKQADIIAVSRKLGRAVRFSDLTRRWATDQKYHHYLAAIAKRFHNNYCTQAPATRTVATVPPPPRANQPPPLPARRRAGVQDATAQNGILAAAPSKPADHSCSVLEASYGGRKTVLIRQQSAEQTNFTVLTVLDGYEKSLTTSYIAQRAPGGTVMGTFEDRQAALTAANRHCPSGANNPPAAKGASAS